MKRASVPSVLAAAFLAGASCNAASIVDGVMTITQAGSSSEFTAEELAALKDGSVTNVYVNVTPASFNTPFVLDADLTGYTGGWTIACARMEVATATGAFGSGTSEEAAIVLPASSVNKSQIFVRKDVKATVSNPICVNGSDSGWSAFYLNDDEKQATTTLTCNGKVTLAGGVKFHMQGRPVLNFNAGFEQKSGIITDVGANGHIHVYNVPCSLNQINVTWLYLDLHVAGNRINTIDLTNGGGKVNLHVDGALADGVATLQNLGGSCALYLKGHDCTLAELKDSTSSGYITSDAGVPATLTFTNTADVAIGAILNGPLSLVKCGAGKATFAACEKKFTGSLEIREGEVAFDNVAKLTSCSKVVLAGGKLSASRTGVLGDGLCALEVADADAQGVISAAAGVQQECTSFKVGDEDKGQGFFGGTASSATTKLACFDAAGEGLFVVNSTLAIDVASGETKTLVEAVGSDVLAKIKANVYTKIVKTGAGTLTLDESLTGYTGSWLLSGGQTCALAVADVLGVAGVEGLDGITVESSKGAKLDVGEEGKTLVVDKPITITGGYASESFTVQKGVVELNKLFNVACDNCYMVIYGSGGHLHFKGGLKGNTLSDNAANGQIHFYAPVDMNYVQLSWLNVYFHDVGLKFGTFSLCSSGIKLPASDLFVPAANLSLPGIINGSGTDTGATWDLNGFDFAVNNFSGGRTSTLKNSSDTPATLSFVQTDGVTNGLFYVRGKTSLVKGGAAEWAVKTQFDADGSLTVTNGLVRFLPTGGWQTCTGVTLAGETAALALEASTNLPSRVTVRVSDGAKIDLADGVLQHVGDLYLDGKPVSKSGTYGAAGSGAKNVRACFTGTGLLHVHGTHDATVLIVR